MRWARPRLSLPFPSSVLNSRPVPGSPGSRQLSELLSGKVRVYKNLNPWNSTYVHMSIYNTFVAAPPGWSWSTKSEATTSSGRRSPSLYCFPHKKILQEHLHGIFNLWFFMKAPTWSPDSYPKFVSDIKSILPRYSNSMPIPCILSIRGIILFF